jgi:hypothetical protein
MSVTVGPVVARIAAPPELVYQMLSAIGQGEAQDGERAEVIEQHGDVLVADFWTRVRLPAGSGRLVRTRERVTLRPPDRVECEHLDGPVRGLRETITVGPDPAGGTRLTYIGLYLPRGALDHVRARIAGAVIRRIVRQHFDGVRRRAEARAARSRVFLGEATVGPRP